MVPLRFTTLLLGLLLACVFAKASIAHPHQVVTEPVTTLNGVELGSAEGHATFANQELQNNIIEASISNEEIKGRKMLMEKMLRELTNEDANGGSSEISGATHFVRKCENQRKVEFNGKSRLSERKLVAVKVNVVGLLSLTADYHLPGHHPPKNN